MPSKGAIKIARSRFEQAENKLLVRDNLHANNFLLISQICLYGWRNTTPYCVLHHLDVIKFFIIPNSQCWMVIPEVVRRTALSMLLEYEI